MTAPEAAALLGLSLSDLRALLGMSRQHMNRYRRGTMPLPAYLQAHVATATSLTPFQLRERVTNG